MNSVRINYYPPEHNYPNEPDWPAEIELEGNGDIGVAVADMLSMDDKIMSRILAVVEENLAMKAMERAIDEADYRYHMVRDEKGAA